MRATSRFNLYPVVVVDGVPERDVFSDYWYRFKPKARPTYHRVLGDEVHRPDLIAYREYGDKHLWWLILRANGVVDAFALVSGQLLQIPALSDWWAFYHEALG